MADPLATIPSEEGDDTKPNEEKVSYETDEELLELVSFIEQVDMQAEDMDPLEYAFRKVVSVPAHYYWDVVKDEKDIEKIPRRIKLWHNSFRRAASIHDWTEKRIALPIARGLGLTDNKFHEITMFMDEKDWKNSERMIREREEERQQKATAVNEV